MSIHTYKHTFIHTTKASIHVCIRSYTQVDEVIKTSIPIQEKAHVHTYKHTHTPLHTSMHAYLPTYIHTYTQSKAHMRQQSKQSTWQGRHSRRGNAIEYWEEGKACIAYIHKRKSKKIETKTRQR